MVLFCMKKIATGFISATVLSMSIGFAFAGENCQCRAGGQYYQTGSLICMGTGDNRQMARCEMALNNTSWKMLGEQCPYAFSDPVEIDQNLTPRPEQSSTTAERS